MRIATLEPNPSCFDEMWTATTLTTLTESGSHPLMGVQTAEMYDGELVIEFKDTRPIDSLAHSSGSGERIKSSSCRDGPNICVVDRKGGCHIFSNLVDFGTIRFQYASITRCDPPASPNRPGRNRFRESMSFRGVSKKDLTTGSFQDRCRIDVCHSTVDYIPRVDSESV